MTPTLRVATLNAWGRRGDWPSRRHVLASGFETLAPDLVALQEVIRTGGADQVRDLLGPGLHVAHHSDREQDAGADVEDGQGISIASRWPVTGVREVDLNVTPRTAGFACSALVAAIEAPPPFGPLLFVNHLPSWQLDFEHERELQAVALARVLEELVADRPLHVIVAGDFDADPSAASVRFWTGRQSLGGTSVCYRDAWESAHADDPGHTFTPRNRLVADPDWPFRRIDYILVRCGEHGGPTLAVSSCDRIFEHPVGGVQVSDHFGVTAELTVPAARNP
jgi:endonuclease/exonuclease/phosphatase family metal-dependent hydrolase